MYQKTLRRAIPVADLPASGRPAILPERRRRVPGRGMNSRKAVEEPRIANTARIIASLNSLNRGPMEAIGTKLEQAREACLVLEESGLAERLGEAHGALLRGDVKTYRKRVELVISRLGHRK